MPPIEPLYGWVRRHASSLGVRDDNEARAAAWGIALKIAREGQKPTWLVRDNLGKLSALARSEIERELLKALRTSP
jgi:hypothetical protein